MSIWPIEKIFQLSGNSVLLHVLYSKLYPLVRRLIDIITSILQNTDQRHLSRCVQNLIGLVNKKLGDVSSELDIF